MKKVSAVTLQCVKKSNTRTDDSDKSFAYSIIHDTYNNNSNIYHNNSAYLVLCVACKYFAPVFSDADECNGY